MVKCRDRIISCGATPLGVLTPAQCVLPYADPLNDGSLRLTYSGFFPFRSPLEVHSASTFPAAISPPAALCMERGKAYSLFLNGLITYNTFSLKLSTSFSYLIA